MRPGTLLIIEITVMRFLLNRSRTVSAAATRTLPLQFRDRPCVLFFGVGFRVVCAEDGHKQVWNQHQFLKVRGSEARLP